jgi:acetolactate synthase small subunit
MPDFDEHIKRITDKLQHLLRRYGVALKENERLKNELAVVKAREKEKDELLKLLSLRIEVLKASRAEMTEEDKRSFEKKINRYLKEVDKCISLLNE